MDKQYSEKYDAYYDADTGEWLESKCDDPNCEYCSNRQDKLTQKRNEIQTRKYF